ncbi:TadE/TadG family type IV pilus assembly protein [Methylobacterium sp. J-090]|uniref:TadE/TadG family type IV pilus assembly protein n=1 Tax=Methylobacterium sp. J-090 TaxID=2836666 RepID=UPI001FB94B6A|nr:TadE/TadG family type IV pilus assembly protein [Methylobacterium sp. J-090]MCJ2080022.1 pilus assembly protein TadG-related protein [Methylobacterium sp. J-090]
MSRFLGDRRGNIAVIFGLSFVPLMFIAGTGIDYGRASAMRTRLQNAVDGTALSLCQTSTATTSAALEDQATKLIASYMPAATLTTPLAIGANPRTILVKATATYTTAFASLLRINTINVSASSQCATPMAQTFEIAIALDTTGSMNKAGGSGTKMAAAQDATKKFVDYVYTKPAFSPQTRISIVPFAAAVAVDPNTYGAATSWIDGSSAPKSAYHWTNVDFSAANATVKAAIKNRLDIFAQLKKLDSTWGWAGCLETLPYPLNVQDAAPTAGNPDSYFVPMFAPDEPAGNTTGLARIYGDYNYNIPSTTDRYASLNPSVQNYSNSYLEDHTAQSDCSAKTMTASEAEMRACKYYKPTQYSSPTSTWLSIPNGPNFLCTSKPLQTLTNDTVKLKALVDGLAPLGSTNIFEGFMWAWRTISPLSVFAQGTAYSDTTVRKVIVLMTDGFNSWNTNADLGISNINNSLFSAMGYITNGNGTKVSGSSALAGRLVTGTATPTSDAQARAALDALTREACTNAKARNIAVFTIGFSVPNDPIDQAGIDLLRDCATVPAQAYVANSSTALIAAFDDIAKSIGKLRIVR